MTIFTGPARLLRQQVGDRHVAGVALAAEVAAHGDDVDADAAPPGCPPPATAGCAPGTAPWRAPDLHATRGIDVHQAGVRLQVALVAAGHVEGVLHDEVRLAEARLDVALGPGQPRRAVVHVRGVALRREARVGSRVRRGSAARPAASPPAGRTPPGSGSYSTSIRLSASSAASRRLRRHRRDPVADVAHAVPAEHRHVAQDLALVVTRHVLAGQHRHDAGHASRRRGVDRA